MNITKHLAYLTLISTLCAPAFGATLNPAPVPSLVLIRNLGLAGASLFGLIDIINRWISFSEVNEEQTVSTTPDSAAVIANLRTLNTVFIAVGALAPAAGITALAFRYLCKNEQPRFSRVAFGASLFAFAGTTTELGTAIQSLITNNQMTDDPAFTSPPNTGRWIASIILSSGATACALGASVAGGIWLTN